MGDLLFSRNKQTVIATLCAGAALLGVGYWFGLSQRATSSACGLPSNPTAGPGYVGFSPLEVELGRHPWYAEVPFTATFVNTRPEPVTVGTVRSSCGCTVLERASYADVSVEAGGELHLHGTLDVGQLPGEYRKKLDLLLESGSMHPVFLKYVAYATYDFKPRNLRFGEVDLDDPTDDAIASVVFFSETASIVGDAGTDSPWLQAAVHNGKNVDPQVVVGVLKQYLPHGRNLGRVSVATDDPYRPTFTIPVHADGVSDVRAVPSHVFLRAGEQREVHFITKEGATARLADARSDTEGVEVSIEGERHVVRVRLNVEALTNAAVVSVTDDEGRVSRFLGSLVR
jgi:hypothetical protein